VGVAAALLVAAPATALPVGYNDDGPRLAVAGAALSQSNTQIARFGVDWETIEPHDDQWDFASTDAAVDVLRSEGIRPVLAVVGSPSWAGVGTPGIQCPCDRGADPEWQQMWQVVALRYPDVVLEVWNEPNHFAFGSVSTSRMAELVNEAAAAIWGVDPGRRVLGPPVSPIGRWKEYLASLYKGINKRVDLAANFYPYGHLRENFRADLGTVRRIARKRDVWITEANVSTGGTLPVSRAKQAQMIRFMYSLAKAKHVEAVIFHRFWSPYKVNASIPFGWDAGQSALHADGTPRRMYGVIGKLHRGYRPARLPRIPPAQIPPITLPPGYIQGVSGAPTSACPG
jgi:hypothetical protein